MVTDTLESAIGTSISQATTAAHDNVLISIATLASSGLFENYMIYERGGECWFGGDVSRSVILYADRLESLHKGRLAVRQASGKGLIQALVEELSTWKGEWQASGWAGFELAYALNDPTRLNESERAGKVPLFYLCQPKLSVSLNQKNRHIETKNAQLKNSAMKLLDNPRDFHITTQGVEVPGSGIYQKIVNNAVKQIQNGALEKVILSRKLVLDFSPDFVATWLHGRHHNTPSRSFSMKLGGWQASGFSPEIVMSLDRNRIVTTEPLAGTCRRDGFARDDFSRFSKLYSDPKETHEHAISVYLSTSEIKEVCDDSSIAIRQFMERKERGSVQHLASTICGKLKQGLNAWDAFAHIFPAVTASGIPKKAAFKEIRRSEKESRGLYAGAILHVDYHGTLDAALVLRSLLGHEGSAWLQAGAGIVSYSKPERELTETSEKLSSIAPWVVGLET